MEMPTTTPNELTGGTAQRTLWHPDEIQTTPTAPVQTSTLEAIPQVPKGEISLSNAPYTPISTKPRAIRQEMEEEIVKLTQLGKTEEAARLQQRLKSTDPSAIPTSQAMTELERMDELMRSPEFSSMPDTQQRVIQDQARQLRESLGVKATAQPYVTAREGQRIKSTRAEEVKEAYSSLTKDVSGKTIANEVIADAMRDQLELIFPEIKNINVNYADLSAVIPDLKRIVESAKFGQKESAVAAGGFALGAGAATGRAGAVLPAGFAAGIRAFLHMPQARSRFAFALHRQMTNPGSAFRSAQAFEEAFRRANPAEIARISTRIEQALAGESGASQPLPPRSPGIPRVPANP